MVPELPGFSAAEGRGDKVCSACGQAMAGAGGGEGETLCPECVKAGGRTGMGLEVGLTFPVAFGDYELLGKISEGGMGVIYRARQRRLNRLVAVKMIRTGRSARASDIQRFRIEAAAAANLDHPNILPVFEINEHEGQLFFSMKLVEGSTLAEQIHRGEWVPGVVNAAERQQRIAGLMVLLARAAQHAHERGVLHRDLKPGNILFDGRGTAYLMDFGLAKFLQDDSALTHTSAVLGTFGYMAPEQASGNVRAITTAADVYGLGAIFYDLLTGHAPFEAKEALVLLRQALESEPVGPRKRNEAVDGDLETICLKCLDKDPRRRYGSAEALAEDLERWRRDEPIAARPAQFWERGLKWARRHRGPLVGGAVAASLLAVAITGYVWQRTAARQRAFLNEHQRVEKHFTEGDPALAVAALARLSRRDLGDRVTAERLLNALAQHSFLVCPGPELPETTRMAGWRGDGEAVVLAGGGEEEGWLGVWRREDGRMTRLEPGLMRTHSVDLSLEPGLVAGASEERVRVWDMAVSVEQPILDRASPTGLVRQVRFLPGRRLLVLAGDRVAQWSLAPGGEELEFRAPAELVVQMAVAKGNDVLAGATDTGMILLWDLAGGGVLRSWPEAHGRVVRDLQFNPDGTLLASAAADGAVRVWNVRNGRRLLECRHEQGIHSVMFSPDGSRLVTASRDRSARVWDAASGQPLGRAMMHGDSVNTARFSADGRQVVTAADNGSVRVWDGLTGQPLTVAARFGVPVLGAFFCPTGREILVLLEAGGAQIRVPTPRQPLWQVSNLPPPPEPAPLAPAEQAALLALHGGSVPFVDVSLDGRLLATADGGLAVRVFNRRSLAHIIDPLSHAAPVNCARFSPDSRRIATSSADRTFRVWDTWTGVPLTDPIPTDAPVARVWFSADGTVVVTDGGRAWSIFQLSERGPEWLPELGEAVAGVRISASEAPVAVASGAFARLAASLRTQVETGPAGAWLQQFLARTMRTGAEPVMGGL